MGIALHLDLSTTAFLTSGDGTQILGLNNQPIRVAHCVSNNREFVNVVPDEPVDLAVADWDHPSAKEGMSEISKRIVACCAKGSLIHVSGHGFWTARNDYETVLAYLKG